MKTWKNKPDISTTHRRGVAWILSKLIYYV